jgi:SAM-dependent methyltransferase
MTDAALAPTRCAICGSPGNASEIYSARLAPDAFSTEVFSARRLPDGLHYRLVRCLSCGLVRSDPAADPERIARIYERSTFDYGGEVENLATTYGGYLRDLERFGARRGSLLEIGCGNGFFLEEALRQGYADAHGVEPSSEAVARASAAIRQRIVVGVIRPGLFPAESFDVICLFQVLDHFPDPAAVLDECLTMLKPGGLVLCLNHNVDAVSARLLGEESPIVDVEHTYLFGPRTLRLLFERLGFRVERVAAAWNRYSLRYLFRLLPLPGFLKKPLLALLGGGALGRVSLSVPLGNVYAIARKPGDGSPEAP